MRQIATNGVFVIAALVLLATAALILGGWSLIAPSEPAWAEEPTGTATEPAVTAEPTSSDTTASAPSDRQARS